MFYETFEEFDTRDLILLFEFAFESAEKINFSRLMK